MPGVLRPEVIQVRMTRDERKQLEKVAEHEKRSLASLIRWLVAEHARTLDFTDAA